MLLPAILFLISLLGATVPVSPTSNNFEPSKITTTTSTAPLCSKRADCNNHGECVSGTCQCDLFKHSPSFGGGVSRYAGPHCEFFSCGSFRNTDPQVCGGPERGSCVDFDTCICKDLYRDYFGDRCQYTYCGQFQSWDPRACGGVEGRGRCVARDVCECFEGWAGSGSACDAIVCGGILPGDPAVCSRRGSCVRDESVGGKCVCEEGFYGTNCELVKCAGRLSHDANVCNGSGICVLADGADGICDCAEGFSGPYCGIPECFGIWANESTRVCSGHGTCDGRNLCTCDPGYDGHACQHATCHGEFALLSDNFFVGGPVDSKVWNVAETVGAEVTSGGCGSMKAPDGMSLHFSGEGERRAQSVRVAIDKDRPETHLVSFWLLLGTGAHGCDRITYTDKVEVLLVTFDQSGGSHKHTLASLSPLDYQGLNRRVELEFVPTGDFAIEISQPVRFEAMFGTFSIDGFYVGFGKYRDAPCSFNGRCEDGVCKCRRELSAGPECTLKGCTTPKFTEMIPSEGNFNVETKITITGCFADVTKVRFYPTWMDREHPSATEVVATMAPDGSNLTCVVPPRSVFGTDHIRVDVFSEGKGWVHDPMAIFTYVWTDTGGGGVSEYEPFGVYWHPVDANCEVGSEIEVKTNVVFLRPYTDGWYHSNISATRSITITVNAQIADQRINLRQLVYESLQNPLKEDPFGLDVLCTCVHGDQEEVPCHAFARYSKIPIPQSMAEEYCDRFLHQYDAWPDWSMTLPGCHSDSAQAILDPIFAVEPTCSDSDPNAKTCNFLYPSASECYVAAGPEGKRARRCCYDRDEMLLVTGNSIGTSDYCAVSTTPGVTTLPCDLPFPLVIDESTGAMRHVTNHWEADVLPFLLCRAVSEKMWSDRYVSRRPNTPTSSPASPTCHSVNDPHLGSFDGVRYDFHGLGKYHHLYFEDLLNVQGYLYRPGSGYTIDVAIAFQHFNLEKSPKIQVRVDGTALPVVLVDDVEVDIATLTQGPPLSGFALITMDSPARLTFRYHTGEQIVADCHRSLINVYISGLPKELYYKKTRGLCGNWSGDSSDDLVGRDTEIYHTSGGPPALYKFAQSWNVSHSDKDLFTLPECMPTYPYIYCHPQPQPDPHDIPASLLELYKNDTRRLNEMTEICKKYAPPELVHDCIYDAYYLPINDTIENVGVIESILDILERLSAVVPVLKFTSCKGPVDCIARQNHVTSFRMTLEDGTPSLRNFSLVDVTLHLVAHDELFIDDEALIELFTTLDVDVATQSVRVGFSALDVVHKQFAIRAVIGDESAGLYRTTELVFTTLCEEGLAGKECTEAACFDIPATDRDVCSGHGDCVSTHSPPHCTCDPNFLVPDCAFKQMTPLGAAIAIRPVSGFHSTVLPYYESTVMHSYDALVMEVEVNWLPGSVETPVSFRWSYVGPTDLQSIALTPVYEKQLGIKPGSFPPYSNQHIQVEVFTLTESEPVVKVGIQFSVLPGLYLSPSEIAVKPDDPSIPSSVMVDCSSFKFPRQEYSFSVIDPLFGAEIELLSSADSVVHNLLLPPVTGVVELHIKVHQNGSLMENVVVKKVTIPGPRRVLTREDILKICDDALSASNQRLSRRLSYLTFAAMDLVYNARDFSPEDLQSLRLYVLSTLHLLRVDEGTISQFLSVMELLSQTDVQHVRNSTVFEHLFSESLWRIVTYHRSRLSYEDLMRIQAAVTGLFSTMLRNDRFGSELDVMHQELLKLVESLLSEFLIGQRENQLKHLSPTSPPEFEIGYVRNTMKTEQAKRLDYDTIRVVPPLYFAGEGTTTVVIEDDWVVESLDRLPFDYIAPVPGTEPMSRIAHVLRDQAFDESSLYLIELSGTFGRGSGHVAFWDGNRLVVLREGVRVNMTVPFGTPPTIELISMEKDLAVVETNAPDVYFLAFDKPKSHVMPIWAQVVVGVFGGVIGAVVLCLCPVLVIVCITIMRQAPQSFSLNDSSPLEDRTFSRRSDRSDSSDEEEEEDREGGTDPLQVVISEISPDVPTPTEKTPLIGED